MTKKILKTAAYVLVAIASLIVIFCFLLMVITSSDPIDIKRELTVERTSANDTSELIYSVPESTELNVDLQYFPNRDFSSGIIEGTITIDGIEYDITKNEYISDSNWLSSKLSQFAGKLPAPAMRDTHITGMYYDNDRKTLLTAFFIFSDDFSNVICRVSHMRDAKLDPPGTEEYRNK